VPQLVAEQRAELVRGQLGQQRQPECRRRRPGSRPSSRESSLTEALTSPVSRSSSGGRTPASVATSRTNAHSSGVSSSETGTPSVSAAWLTVKTAPIRAAITAIEPSRVITMVALNRVVWPWT